MNNTRAALPRTHAVSPASIGTRGSYQRHRSGRERATRQVAASRPLRPWLRSRPAPAPPCALLPAPPPAPPRAPSDQLVHRSRPDLAVADLPGGRSFGDDLHHVVGVVIRDDDVETDLRNEVDGVLRAPVDLGVTLLAAVAADLADGEALHAEALQCTLHVVELER